ncbi:lariat debranching enzyme isoform X2 [Phoenix dactylifera]|uniref:Lariat debranching enzyme isoform X2 n=1 Tax=Phoenix dactylifera TaxID=42345 RepID=A0A8B9ACN9_PHODC|nr:lariat debranching enzyme isoform X2 [Phoenix dactylifera]
MENSIRSMRRSSTWRKWRTPRSTSSCAAGTSRYYGGWAAPNIYFLGYSGVIKFGNIRIGGLSGIYKPREYHLGHYEMPPYDENDIRSVYHVREYDVMKLKEVKGQIDIFMSHDWPLRITEYGNWEKLVRHKPFFRQEVLDGTLGSVPAAELLKALQPRYWFSAHLHCKFPAIIQHGENGPVTKFLALDKCLRGRKFLQIVDIEADPGPYEVQYDEEWLAITRKFNSIFPLTRKSVQLGGLDKQDYQQWVRNKLNARGAKPFDFVPTVPSFDPSQPLSNRSHCGNLLRS